MVFLVFCYFLINGGIMVEDLFFLLSVYKLELVSGFLKLVKINLYVGKERININNLYIGYYNI